ncbi:MAG: DNA topoisomerase IV subunit A [Sphingomonadales bacterium]
MNARSDNGEKIVPISFVESLSEKYLAYALSTIMARSLPDVRDGLKPVHRRLLYAMRLLKLDPGSGFKKCARVVGDVIGKYHPHGDQSVYDALVRLSQDFSVRYPLIDGQGNFGNIDGDNAAAMRYTEARMTTVSKALMEGLEEGSVDFRETYDGEEEEPIVFPAAFPNLLANGATGIAVGMATSIPPHNVAELCDGLLMLIDFRRGLRSQLSIGQLVNRIPGPDFPTGGLIVEPHENIQRAYETGRGSFRIRSKWHREDIGHGGYQIVITEIPFQVQKSRLIEKIAELVTTKKLPILTDVLDESSEDIRIVLEPKNRTIDENVLMESLFKLTDLETKIPLNLNVLDKNCKPVVMSLKEALEAFLDHRLDVLLRRLKFRLVKIEHRMEILTGYLVAFLNLDEVIRIIREEDDSKQMIIMRFSLSDIQAEAILNMRLRSLRKLEELELRTEHNDLAKEKNNLETMMNSDDKQWESIGTDIQGIKETFGPKTVLGKRRSDFADTPDIEINTTDVMIEKEPVTVICSKMGWVRAMRGHLDPDEDIKFKEGDSGRYQFHAQTTDKLLLLATNGKFYTIGADKLPSGRGNGEPLRLMLDFGNDEEIVAFFPYIPGGKVLLASTIGKGFIADTDNLLASTKGGKQVMNLSGPAKAKICTPANGDSVAIFGDNKKLLIFKLEEVSVMSRGQGVTLQKYNKGGMSDIKTFNLEEGLTWRMGGSEGRTRTETDLEMWTGRRANAGKFLPKGFPNRRSFD